MTGGHCHCTLHTVTTCYLFFNLLLCQRMIRFSVLEKRRLCFVLLSLVSECLVFLQTHFYCLLHYCQNTCDCLQICMWMTRKSATQTCSDRLQSAKKKKGMLLSDSVCSISLTAESFAAGWVRDAWGGGFDTKALPCFNNLTTACSESPFHFPDFEVWQKVCWHYIFINRVTPCCLWMEHVNPLRS